MALPFSHEQFFDVFAAYNLALWPFAAALWALSLGAFVLVVRGRRGHRAVTGLLAVHWAWVAVAYQWAYFAVINPAAVAFAAAFLAQALLLGASAWRGSLRYAWQRTPRHLIGVLMAGYGLLYPAMAALVVGFYPHIPTFGVPCPTTLLTIGFLLMATPIRMSLLIIPWLWTIIGGSAALLFGVVPDFALLVAGLVLLLLMVTPLRQLLVVLLVLLVPPATPPPGTALAQAEASDKAAVVCASITGAHAAGAGTLRHRI